MSQLPADCLNEIFEYLEEDKVTLHSCLQVNRLWCEASVRILWRIIRNYNTLIACLPDESKEILFKNGITSALASKSPMFNYASFCKVLSIHQVNYKIEQFLNQQHISSQSLNDNLYTATQEIFKFLVNQISLRTLDLYSNSSLSIQNFTSLPGTKDCLNNLTELYCDSDIHSDFFYQLSQTCCNIQSLNITFVKVISNGLTDLISAQQNLKYLYMMQYYDCEILTTDIINSLNKLPNTLTKLNIHGDERFIPLSFMAKFTHLQEIILSFINQQDDFEDFKKLQCVNFSQLQILKFQYECPGYELLVKFLENNGKNLKELYADCNNNSLSLAIVKFCPNIRKLSVLIRCDELETLKMIFNSCQYLESVKIWYHEDYYNSESDLFEVIVKYSPRNFHELRLSNSCNVRSGLLPEELESFFISWENRISQKSLSLIIICNDADILYTKEEYLKIIEKYIELGIIKKFKVIDHYFDDFHG